MKQNKNGSMKLRNRTKTKGVGAEVCTVRSQVVYGYPATNSFGIARNYYSIEPLNGACNNVLASKIAANYEFYRIKSAEVRFIPAGGDNMTGSVVCSIIRNPELMKSYVSADPTNRDNILYTEQGCEVFSLAHGGTKRMDASRQGSRTWYSINYSVDSSVNEYDRCVAAMFVVHHQYIAEVVVPGNFQWSIVYEFKGMGRVDQYTLTTITDLGDYVVPYDSSPYPLRVLLRNRQGEEEVYEKPASPPNPN